MTAHILDFTDIKKLVGERAPTSHKGDNGRCLVLGGSDGFFGAVAMCSAAALRSGAGTVKTYSPEGARILFSGLPEVMVHGFEGKSWDYCDMSLLETMLSTSDCYAIGPGMGKAENIINVLELALQKNKPTIIDADGLNILSKSRKFDLLHEKCVLTPHIGEMSRLTELSTAQIKADMMRIAVEYAEKWGCTVLLKSDKSCIANQEGQAAINHTGNAGLAKGGSGDVLSGIVLAMLGQKLSPFDAACAGAYLLGASAEEAVAVLKERMLVARDVISIIEATICGLE